MGVNYVASRIGHGYKTLLPRRTSFTLTRRGLGSEVERAHINSTEGNLFLEAFFMRKLPNCARQPQSRFHSHLTSTLIARGGFGRTTIWNEAKTSADRENSVNDLNATAERKRNVNIIQSITSVVLF